MLSKKLIKTAFILSGALLVSASLVILLISPIAKHVAEKYDNEYTGREIKLNRVYINPFTGYIHINGLKILEQNSDSVFISASDLYCNISMASLFSGTLEFSQIMLNNPCAVVRQNKKEFNFTDLIKKFSPGKSLKKNKALRVNLLNLEINNGNIVYIEPSIPVRYSILKLHMESKGKMWNEDSINASVTLNSGIGTGTMNGKVKINIHTLRYDVESHFKDFDLSVMEQYLKDITHSANLSATMDAKFKASGNFKNPEDINMEGLMSVNNLHFGETGKEDYLAFKKLSINIKRLNPKNKKYLFDSVSLIEPYFLYKRYDTLDNIQNMFGKQGGKIRAAKAQTERNNLLFQIADYIKVLAKNFFKSNFEVNKVAVYSANLRYSDYTMSEKFEIAADPLFIIADSIKRSHKWVAVSLQTNLKPYGNIKINLSINPKDSSDFSMNYRVRNVPATIFNPYIIKYTSYPLQHGTISVEGSWSVNNGNILSKNHFVLIDPWIGIREEQNATIVLPLKFIMFFIRERGNVIDYEVPITGNLKHPKFKFNDVIYDALSNLFIKPPTTVYRAEVRELENDIENAFDFSWLMNTSMMGKREREFTEDLSEHLLKNPSSKINISAIPYMTKEKENIVFFEARKLFYYSLNPDKKKLTYSDTLAILQIPVKSKWFIIFLDKHPGAKGVYTVQDKCTFIVGQSKVDQLYEQLNTQRKKIFLSCFKSSGVEKRIIFTTLNKVPYNGLSCYRIGYNGTWPEKLLASYKRMNDLDKKTPRNKFSSQRKKNMAASLNK